MKTIPGLALGAAVAITLGCAAGSKPAQMPAATAAEPTAGGAPADPRSEIDRLDQAISNDMGALALTRPTPPPLTCTSNCAQQMSGAAAAATAPPAADCRPGASQSCTDICTLKGSICENAGRICKIAADLGGTDAYANDKCSSGTASCDAAKQRCCSCL